MPHYFDFEAADPKDRQLRLAKEMNVVPEGCLLNGSLVMGLHYTSHEDTDETYVCGMCREGPRDRCGGFEFKDDAETAPGDLKAKDRHLMTADDASFRALERGRVVDVLNSLVDSGHD